MCGIVGLYLKNPALESQLGALFEPMLLAMTDRGPDSAGFAIYGDDVRDGWVKLTLQSAAAVYDWKALMGELEGRQGCSLDWLQNASAAVLAWPRPNSTVARSSACSATTTASTVCPEA